MGGGGGTSQNWDAGNLFASVAREQYDLGTNLSVAPEAALKDASKGGLMVPTLQAGRDAVRQGFAAQRQGLGLDLARRNIGLDAQQQASVDRTMGLAEASAGAGLDNAARMHEQTRRLGILSGGMSSNLVSQKMQGK